MRYSLLGMFGLTALVAILAAAQRAMGTIVVVNVIHALMPVILWFTLLFVHFETNDNRLALFRFALIIFCVVFIAAPLVGNVPTELFFYQIAVVVFFWGLQYLAVVSWTEGT